MAQHVHSKIMHAHITLNAHTNLARKRQIFSICILVCIGWNDEEPNTIDRHMVDLMPP